MISNIFINSANDSQAGQQFCVKTLLKPADPLAKKNNWRKTKTVWIYINYKITCLKLYYSVYSQHFQAPLAIRQTAT